LKELNKKLLKESFDIIAEGKDSFPVEELAGLAHLCGNELSSDKLIYLGKEAAADATNVKEADLAKAVEKFTFDVGMEPYQ